MDLRPACPCPTFTRMNKRPQGYAGGDATVPVDEGFDAGFSSESLVFIKLEMYSVTARRSSPVLSRRRPFTARAISSVDSPRSFKGGPVLSGLSPRSLWQRAHRARKSSLPVESNRARSCSDGG